MAMGWVNPRVGLGLFIPDFNWVGLGCQLKVANLYLDVHCNWVEKDFTSHHAALAVRHFGPTAHTAPNIYTAVCDILIKYGICNL